MIDPKLIEHLFEIIEWHRTWIAVKDFGEVEEYAAANGDRVGTIRCRVLRFEVRVGTQDYNRGQILAVPEFELQAAIERLSLDKSFKHRLDSLTLTYDDVNNLVNAASWGQIELELE